MTSSKFTCRSAIKGEKNSSKQKEEILTLFEDKE
jgi:hypothetical protein